MKDEAVSSVRRAGKEALITVIVPVYNERETIQELLRRLREAPFRKQIIVVDDCSNDGTSEILAQERDILHLRLSQNVGKGAAIRAALPYAEGEVTIIQDADLEYDPDEIPKVVEPILQGETEVAYGCRFTRGLPKAMPLPNKIANLVLAWAVRLLYRYPLRDEATCYKAFRTELLRSLNLRCQRFEFCPEVTAKSLKRGYKIVEVPIERYRPRTRRQGKKIHWTDGLEALWTLIRYRFRD
jgi:glycosyltransferase involved in cell wall biosynthesis